MFAKLKWLFYVSGFCMFLSNSNATPINSEKPYQQGCPHPVAGIGLFAKARNVVLTTNEKTQINYITFDLELSTKFGEKVIIPANIGERFDSVRYHRKHDPEDITTYSDFSIINRGAVGLDIAYTIKGLELTLDENTTRLDALSDFYFNSNLTCDDPKCHDNINARTTVFTHDCLPVKVYIDRASARMESE